MNENLNLVEILKDCPKGTKLYSTVHGAVKFERIDIYTLYPILVVAEEDKYRSNNLTGLTEDGRLWYSYKGECILFPSKEQRDWSKFKVPSRKFDPKTLKPFDKVLVKEWGKWTIDFFSYISTDSETPYYCVGHFADIIIPYNDGTKHLVGTIEEAPEYYRYWED